MRKEFFQVKEQKQRAIADLEDKLRRRPAPHEVQLQKIAPAFIEPLKDHPVLREGESAYFSARYTPNNDADVRVEWLVRYGLR